MSTTNTKRLHASALSDALAFRELFPATAYARWEFAGSLRWGRPEVGDVEHVIIPAFGEESDGGLFGGTAKVNLLWRRLDELVVSGTCGRHIYGVTGFRWGPKYRGVDYRGFTHEIFCAEESNWGATLLIRTGPPEFSRRVVTAFHDGGMYRQQVGALIHVASGRPVAVPDERTYLRLAGMGWVEPGDRK